MSDGHKEKIDRAIEALDRQWVKELDYYKALELELIHETKRRKGRVWTLQWVGLFIALSAFAVLALRWEDSPGAEIGAAILFWGGGLGCFYGYFWPTTRIEKRIIAQRERVKLAHRSLQVARNA